MVSKTKTFSLDGIEALDVEVQCQLASGMVNFTIVGLADKSVAESRERIRAAFSSIGLQMPAKRIIVNLSPADIAKEGNHYDLPIILALFASMKMIPQDELNNYVAMGELGLDGSIIPVNGILPSAIAANSQGKGVICSSKNAEEARWASQDMEVLAADSILDFLNHFKRKQTISNYTAQDNTFQKPVYADFKDVKGQDTAKRAAEITAAGRHNMLMIGPPGSGKSMIAARIPGILPEPTPNEILQTSIVHSVAGRLKEGGLIAARPFRSPHHNCSMPAMTGGGTKAKPGEISLAHNGVLFLDELPEFTRQVLDSLRQPLERGEVSISRVNSHVTYPANFQLIAAMNPCKCGYLDDASRACSKAPKCAHEYQMRLSGPLLDRIDIHIEVPAQNPLDAYRKTEGESSEQIKQRVLAAIEIQEERFKNTVYTNNCDIQGEDLYHFCSLENDAQELVEKGVEKLGLSMRGHSKILKTARTIADLEASPNIQKHHIAEALSYRQVNYIR